MPMARSIAGARGWADFHQAIDDNDAGQFASQIVLLYRDGEDWEVVQGITRRRCDRWQNFPEPIWRHIQIEPLA